MKKKLLWLTCVLSLSRSDAMMLRIVEARAEKECQNAAAEDTLKHFGGFEYLAHTEYGQPAAIKLEIVRSVMIDPNYLFIVVPRANGFILKAYETSDVICSIGAIGCIRQIITPDSARYTLTTLKVDKGIRKRGLGTTLFLRALQIMRQQTYPAQKLFVYWLAYPFEGGITQAALNDFYKKLGGGIQTGTTDQFRWEGTSVKPFDELSPEEKAAFPIQDSELKKFSH